MKFTLAQAINSMPSLPETLFEIEVYFINYLGGSPCWSSSDIFSSESFYPIFGQLVGRVGQKPNHEAPANLQEVFSPLQIIINNWLNEISSGQDLYQLQIGNLKLHWHSLKLKLKMVSKTFIIFYNAISLHAMQYLKKIHHKLWLNFQM